MIVRPRGQLCSCPECLGVRSWLLLRKVLWANSAGSEDVRGSRTLLCSLAVAPDARSHSHCLKGPALSQAPCSSLWCEGGMGDGSREEVAEFAESASGNFESGLLSWILLISHCPAGPQDVEAQGGKWPSQAPTQIRGSL